jgi:hypothetical protein
MTYEECFETKEFIEFYRRELDRLWKARNSILNAPNRKLRNDTYRQLGDKGMFQREKMCAEFLLINEKKSNLSSNQRAFIADVIMKCTFQTLEVYKEQAYEAIKNL